MTFDAINVNCSKYGKYSKISVTSKSFDGYVHNVSVWTASTRSDLSKLPAHTKLLPYSSYSHSPSGISRHGVTLITSLENILINTIVNL